MNVARPPDSQKLGISIIHQELNLIPHFSVAENLLSEERRKFFVFDKEKLLEESRSLLARVGLDADPRTIVMELSIAQRQLIEIAKALSIMQSLL